MARSLVQVDLPVGNIAVIVPWMDLEVRSWDELLRDLAELLADQRGVWHARPLDDDESDRKALTGY